MFTHFLAQWLGSAAACAGKLKPASELPVSAHHAGYFCQLCQIFLGNRSLFSNLFFGPIAVSETEPRCVRVCVCVCVL